MRKRKLAGAGTTRPRGFGTRRRHGFGTTRLRRLAGDGVSRNRGAPVLVVHTVGVKAKRPLWGRRGGQDLRRLVRDADAVLLDFDGPVCDLFGDVPTAHIAEEIKVMARLEWGALDRKVEDCDDSHGILQRLRDMLDGEAPAVRSRVPLGLANTIVTGHEYAAVNSAVQAPDVENLLDALLDLGKRLVIVSNNAEEPVWHYLKHAGLEEVLRRPRPRSGRTTSDEARSRRGAPRAERPGRAGSLPGPAGGRSAHRPAGGQVAGVRFLGYTQDRKRLQQMKRNKADGVVSSHAPVIAAARELLNDYSERDDYSERRVHTESK